MSKNDLLTWPNALSTLRILLTPLFVLLLFTEVWYLKSMAFVVFVALRRAARAGRKLV